MSNIAINKLVSISSTDELNRFIGKEIGIHGFAQDENISGILKGVGFDHIKITVLGGFFDGITVKIDLNIKGKLTPTVQYISCDGTNIYMHEGEVSLTRKLSIENKVKVEVINLIRAYESASLSDTSLHNELKDMGIKSPDVIKVVIENRTLRASLIGLTQEDAK